MRRFGMTVVVVASGCLLVAAAATANDGPLVVDGRRFSSWTDFTTSDYFQASGLRCGVPDRAARAALLGFALEGGVPGDCTSSTTNPSSDYDSTVTYEIPVVVHVITTAGGVGDVSDALIESQIDVLNEDFQAMLGTPGAAGTDVALHFVLASEDPGGLPTTGITRSANTTWYNDGGSYWNTLAWDPNRYLNIYTNTAGGNLGYVPFLPTDGGGVFVGNANDRVVIHWQSFGRPAVGGPPYDQGRTVTHEVGHYLGLEHTFSGVCASGSSPACYSNGDLICDTNPEQNPVFGCPGSSNQCASADPYHNYLDYSDDTCMTEFTPEQARRMRCALEHYRPDLYRLATPPIFDDDFESGDTSAWSAVAP